MTKQRGRHATALRPIPPNGSALAATGRDATPGRDPSIAAMVGAWYLESRSAHHNTEVIEAYRQLQTEIDHLFTAITRGARHGAIRIAFTCCVEPYQSDKELIRAVRSERTLEITSAAAVGGRIHPLLGCELGDALIGSALSTTSSVTPGVDMGSISVTSTRRGWFKTVCIMVSLGALWPLSSME